MKGGAPNTVLSTRALLTSYNESYSKYAIIISSSCIASMTIKFLQRSKEAKRTGLISVMNPPGTSEGSSGFL